MFKKTTLSLAVMALTACGGGSSSGGGSNPGSNNDGGSDSPSTTTYSVTVDDGRDGETVGRAGVKAWPERLAALVLPRAWAALVEQLDPSQFTVKIIGEADPLDPSTYQVTDLGNGTYGVTVPGDPRFDCYIAADIDGDGGVDLRVPTVDQNLALNPASEYISRMLEENQAHFASFDVAEINQILRNIQEAVSGSEALQHEMQNAETLEQAFDAIEAELGEITGSEFASAAATEPVTEAELSSLSGDHHLLHALHALGSEKSTYQGEASSNVSSDIWLEYPDSAFLSHDSGGVTLALAGHNEVGTVINVNSGYVENYTDNDPQESFTLSGAATSTGMVINLPESIEQWQEAGESGTETQWAATLGFSAVSADHDGFIGTGLLTVRDEGVDSEFDSTWDDFTKEFSFLILSKKQSGFAANEMAGDWGIVGYEKEHAEFDYDVEVNATPVTFDNDGAYIVNTASAFSYGFYTPLSGGPADNEGSFDLASDSDSGTVIFNADGSYDWSEESGASSMGVVFPGNQMMAEVQADQGEGYGAVEVFVGVRRAVSGVEEALADKTFKLRGLTGWHSGGGMEMSHWRTGQLAFNDLDDDGQADSADMQVISTLADLEVWEKSVNGETGAFSLKGWSVTVSGEGLVQLEINEDEDGVQHRIELNGFLSADGKNLVLALANLDDHLNEGTDGWEPEGSLGLIVATCTNCGD
ncbi:MAG: hypothetical protein V7667_00545 [Alloalcanivorax venustensis]|uniref:hypothetical protein n=1 Tax=Alloalcanivorax venustensis TaxID=172371 RepID=UPI003001A165